MDRQAAIQYLPSYCSRQAVSCQILDSWGRVTWSMQIWEGDEGKRDRVGLDHNTIDFWGNS
jgi:hypothetical protein